METALRTGNLVLPEGFVEIDREEMMYVDGGFYITNNQLWLVLQACALNPIGATLIGLGIYKLAAWITALGAKFGAKIGGLIGGAYRQFNWDFDWGCRFGFRCLNLC